MNLVPGVEIPDKQPDLKTNYPFNEDITFTPVPKFLIGEDALFHKLICRVISRNLLDDNHYIYGLLDPSGNELSVLETSLEEVVWKSQ